MVGSREDLEVVRNGRKTILTRVRTSRHAIEEDLESLEREQAAVQAKLRRSAQQFGGANSRGPGGQPGPIKRGSGQLIWPVNGPITGVFGEARPGHMHAGVDISAPSGTPIRAADSGRVAFAGTQGGYGNMTCIQHTGSMSTCYAHQSSIGVSGGQSVSQGQVIGSVGSTGNSTGPHLHFEVRINGSAVNPMGYL
jgi:murein DD-endopeptidase MepM/ murein hydrolase activator NlpD